MNLTKIYKEIKQDPLLTTVVGGVIVAAICGIWAIVTGKISKQTILIFVECIKNIMIYEIPIWIIFLILIIVKIGTKLKKNKSINKKYNAIITSYNIEEYQGFIYKWDYKIESNKLIPINIHPVCPRCNTALKVKDHYIQMEGDDIIHSVKIYCPRLDLLDDEIIYRYPDDYDEICENVEIVINTNLKKLEKTII